MELLDWLEFNEPHLDWIEFCGANVVWVAFVGAYCVESFWAHLDQVEWRVTREEERRESIYTYLFIYLAHSCILLEFKK